MKAQTVLTTIAALAAIASPAAAAPPSFVQHQGPVLTATLSWQGHSASEPTVLYDQKTRRFRMWYSGGGLLGYAVSPDGFHWAKSTHPVLGHGYGGEPGIALHSSISHIGRVYYAFYSADVALAHPELRYATSPDGIHWRARGTALEPDPGEAAVANTDVWVQGRRWYMLYEQLGDGPNGIWTTRLATGTGPNHWTTTGRLLPSLGIGGMYGGPTLYRDSRGVYHLWEHMSTNGTNLPTEIYATTSTDLVHWTKPQLAVRRSQAAWEVDQVADPSVVRANGKTLMFFDGLHNSANVTKIRSSIGVATLRQS